MISKKLKYEPFVNYNIHCTINKIKMRGRTICAIASISIPICLAVLLVVILIPIGVRVIEQDEYGIRYDNYTKHIYPDIYTQGRYLFNIWDNVVLFKRNYIRIEQTDAYNLPCLSRDGLEIDIDFTSQYQYNEKELIKVMLEYGTSKNAHELYLSISRNSIRNACGNFSAERFFFERGTIESSSLHFIKQDFSDADTHVTIGFLQLTNIKLPDGFVQAIQEKQLAIQDVDKALNERTETLIKAETELKSAEQQANIILINANAEATSIINTANKTSQIIETKWKERALAFASIKNSLGMNETEFVRTYLKSYVLQSVINPTIGL